MTGARFKIKALPQFVDVLARYVGQEVCLGIRPEALTLHALDNTANGMPAVVDVVEPMGGRSLVYALVDGETVVADVSSDIEPKVGEQIDLVFDVRKLHAFDVKTELKLW